MDGDVLLQIDGDVLLQVDGEVLDGDGDVLLQIDGGDVLLQVDEEVLDGLRKDRIYVVLGVGVLVLGVGEEKPASRRRIWLRDQKKLKSRAAGPNYPSRGRTYPISLEPSMESTVGDADGRAPMAWKGATGWSPGTVSLGSSTLVSARITISLRMSETPLRSDRAKIEEGKKLGWRRYSERGETRQRVRARRASSGGGSPCVGGRRRKRGRDGHGRESIEKRKGEIESAREREHGRGSSVCVAVLGRRREIMDLRSNIFVAQVPGAPHKLAFLWRTGTRCATQMLISVAHGTGCAIEI